MSARVIAIANQKGGCGKTTTAVNLSAGLAKLGRRVLLLDIDPQANASMAMGIDISRLDVSMADILLHRDLELKTGLMSLDGVDFVPSSFHLYRAAKELSSITNGELRLRRKMKDVLQDYEFIIFDTPPALGVLLNTALNASREILIPIDVGYYSLIGLKGLLTEVDLLSETNPDLYVSGVLVTMFERTNMSREVYQAVCEQFGGKVFKTRIRKNVRLAESPSHLMNIFRYDPGSHGAEDYLNLCKEVIEWPEKRD